MVTSLDSMLQMLDLHLYKFPEDLEKKFNAELHNFLLHYGWVAKEAGKLGLLRYSMVQKHHLTAHLGVLAKSCHPRCFWTYGSESFMGHMVKIGSASVRGQAAPKAAENILQKYRLSMHLILSGLLVLEDESG